MFLKSFCLLFVLPALIAAKCGEWTTCNDCASHKEDGLFNFECRWCDTTKSCHDFSIDPDCPANNIIDIAYDCPATPQNGFDYDENFAKTKALPLSAAAYSDNPQACLTNALGGAQLKRQLTVHCDESKKDTCSGFTAVSNAADRAIIASFRGSSGTWQLVMEGVDSIFKAKKPFVVGGNVDEYFFTAFYAIWNAGMRDDLLTLKAANPDYELWVTGHSLGGSMASLCASLAIKLNMWPANKVKLVTFGQPRTGDIQYAEAHDNIMLYGYRVVHAEDLVPHIPPKVINDWFDSPYHHRFEIWYDNNMLPGTSYQSCTRADDDTCSNTKSDFSITDHLHYFNIDVSAWGEGGCPASMKGAARDRHLFSKYFAKAKKH
uniref:Fungal lipase-like domain-containing protein n=1 Tax=Plectus sambesii TaxID=2011161 RepID=A0A914WVV5_9BILA